MNEFQQFYCLALALLWMFTRGQRFTLFVLTANLFGNLVAALAMDFGALSAESARGWMMIADLIAGVVLALGPAICKIIAALYAVSVAAYVFGLSVDSTFAVVYVTAFLQLGVVAIGPDTGGNRGNRHGRSSHPVFVAKPGRDFTVHEVNQVCYSSVDRSDR